MTGGKALISWRDFSEVENIQNKGKSVISAKTPSNE